MASTNKRSAALASPEPRDSAEPEDTDGSEELPSGGRPFWSGTISFGLVSIPVTLFPAQKNARSSLRMLAPDGTPLERRYFCPEDGKQVPSEELVRGYEQAPGEYVVVTDDELEALEPKKSRDIELARFVDAQAVDAMFFERAYFLAPDPAAARAYSLLAATMERRGKAGIATFIMRGKEQLVAIFAERGLLRAEILRFRDELRTPEQIGLPAKERPDAELVRTFRRAIQKGSANRLEPAELHDRYWARLVELVEHKRKRGQDLVTVTEPEEGAHGADIIDLMAALKKSLGASTQQTAAKPRASTAAHNKSARAAGHAHKPGPAKARPARAQRSARARQALLPNK